MGIWLGGGRVDFGGWIFGFLDLRFFIFGFFLICFIVLRYFYRGSRWCGRMKFFWVTLVKLVWV